VDASNVHGTIASKREPYTGQWFLESEEYSQWLTGPSRSLFCIGIPGAGKTYLASRAIDDLRDNHLQSDTKIGLAWIYYDYAIRESQNAANNMSSL
jgi:hypothetical protein